MIPTGNHGIRELHGLRIGYLCGSYSMQGKLGSHLELTLTLDDFIFSAASESLETMQVCWLCSCTFEGVTGLERRNRSSPNMVEPAKLRFFAVKC